MNATIRAPILSVAAAAPHEAFFVDALGMKRRGITTLPPDQTSDAVGTSGVPMVSSFLQSIPTAFGVRLWEFSPAADKTLRSETRGTEIDALKVIDFYAPNFGRALDDLEQLGYRPREAIAEYRLPEGTIREAHFWRPDNVVCAVISGPQEFFRRFASICDRTFSEPQSISAPLSDPLAAQAFYEDVFGLSMLYEYRLSDPSFDALVGADGPLEVRARNVGSDLREPYLGLIDYGTRTEPGASLRGLGRPPIRGLLGVEIAVDDIDAVVVRAERFGARLLAGPATLTDYVPYGAVSCALIEGPHGVLHHAIEPTSDAAFAVHPRKGPPP